MEDTVESWRLQHCETNLLLRWQWSMQDEHLPRCTIYRQLFPRPHNTPPFHPEETMHNTQSQITPKVIRNEQWLEILPPLIQRGQCCSVHNNSQITQKMVRTGRTMLFKTTKATRCGKILVAL